MKSKLIIEKDLRYNSEKTCSNSDQDSTPSSKDDPLQRRNKSIQQKITAGSINNIDALSEFIPLSREEKISLKKTTDIFRMNITPYYLSLIADVNDKKDPIRMQSIPDPRETVFTDEEFMDPLGEEKTPVCSCLVHRYPNRVLLIVTSRCFMYCRHCTRKRLWKRGLFKTPEAEIDKAIEYIKKTETIREVIVSGGDPLTLRTTELFGILKKLAAIKNVKVIRIGTRTPVVFPQRIDDALCVMLEQFDNIWMNVQFNHPREITAESEEACRRLQRSGIPMSNQSVLLKGVNDDPDIMRELCEKLMEIRVRPYYLFQCDPVTGSGHFRTSVFKGINIIENMRGHTSGMAVPTFVVDGTDGKGKIPLSPNYMLSASEESITLRNYKFEVFDYQNPT